VISEHHRTTFEFAAHAAPQHARSASSGLVGSRIYLTDFWLPEMRLFSHDPRFQALVTRLKLTQHWRQYGLTCH
jgi:hypothetical protein